MLPLAVPGVTVQRGARGQGAPQGGGCPQPSSTAQRDWSYHASPFLLSSRPMIAPDFVGTEAHDDQEGPATGAAAFHPVHAPFWSAARRRHARGPGRSLLAW